MINRSKVALLTIANLLVLTVAAIYFPSFSIYAFMVLEMLGVFLLIYHELYSKKEQDIVTYNMELEKFYNFRIEELKEEEDKRYLVLLKSKKFNQLIVNPNDTRLAKEILSNHDPMLCHYKNEIERNRTLLESEKKSFPSYTKWKNYAKNIVSVILNKRTGLRLLESKIHLIGKNNFRPHHPTYRNEMPLTKNAILVLGYYLILNGFTLQLMGQINKDFKSSEIHPPHLNRITIEDIPSEPDQLIPIKPDKRDNIRVDSIGNKVGNKSTNY